MFESEDIVSAMRCLFANIIYSSLLILINLLSFKIIESTRFYIDFLVRNMYWVMEHLDASTGQSIRIKE